jgi:hypothetical protein
MTSKPNSLVIEDALHRAGLEWLVDYWGADKTKYLDETRQAISDFIDYYQRRFKHEPDPIRLMAENPEQGRAFFQFDTLNASPEMMAMAWRILEGCEVTRIDLHYDRDVSLSLKICLRTPYGVNEEYSSNHWADFRVLRHFGTVNSENRLSIDGYYAPR